MGVEVFLTKCSQYAGKFETRYIRRKGVRFPATRFQENEVVPDEQEFKAVEILGSRIYEGKAQYLIRWEGYEETTWHDADTLTCVELMEEYELENE